MRACLPGRVWTYHHACLRRISLSECLPASCADALAACKSQTVTTGGSCNGCTKLENGCTAYAYGFTAGAPPPHPPAMSADSHSKTTSTAGCVSAVRASSGPWKMRTAKMYLAPSAFFFTATRCVNSAHCAAGVHT